MALFIQQNDDRSKLQARLTAELREKAKTRAQLDDTLPDGIEDSEYLKDTKPTTSLAWVWLVIVILAVVAMVVIVLKANG